MTIPLLQRKKTIFVIGSSQKSIAILSLLSKEQPKHYSDMLERLGFKKNGKVDRSKSGLFGYYIRNLKLYNLITVNHQREYSITPQGATFLKFWHCFDEQFISEDGNNICHNSEDKTHKIIKVCRNCSEVIK